MFNEENNLGMDLKVCENTVDTVVKAEKVQGSCGLCGVNEGLEEKTLRPEIIDIFKNSSKSLNLGLFCKKCYRADGLGFLFEKRDGLAVEIENLAIGIKLVGNLNHREPPATDGDEDADSEEMQRTVGLDKIKEIKPEPELLEDGREEALSNTKKDNPISKGKKSTSVFDFTNIDKTYLECDGCNLRFRKSNPRAFFAHVHKKNGEVAFRCREGICSKEFNSNTGLLQHLRQTSCGKGREKNAKYPGRRNIKCYFCSRSVYDISCLRLHIRKHTNEYVPYKCKRVECSGVWFKSLYMINRHTTLVHGAKEEIEKFREREGVKIKNHLNNTLVRRKCYFCGKVVSKFSALLYHIRSLHTLERDLDIRCKICLKIFSSERHLKLHFVTIHDANVQLKEEIARKRRDYNKNKCLQHLKCYFCAKQHKRLCHWFTDVRRHINEEELFKCVDCKAVFHSETGLKEHSAFRYGPNNAEKEQLRREHQIRKNRKCREKFSKLTNCEKCGKKLTVGSMKKHLKVCSEEGEERKTCKDCGTKFATVLEATVHFRSKHDSNKSLFACYFCGKIYPKFSILKDHLIRHLKEKLKK